MATITSDLDPLTEIDYRATWLAQNPRAAREVVLEELSGILAAVDRQRSDTHGRLDKLEQAIEEIDEHVRQNVARLKEFESDAS